MKGFSAENFTLAFHVLRKSAELKAGEMHMRWKDIYLMIRIKQKCRKQKLLPKAAVWVSDSGG